MTLRSPVATDVGGVIVSSGEAPAVRDVSAPFDDLERIYIIDGRLVAVRLPLEIWPLVDEIAAREGQTVQDLIGHLLDHPALAQDPAGTLLRLLVSSLHQRFRDRRSL